jgi:hypothetical protein
MRSSLNEKTNKSKEKIGIFVKICKKYIKKIKGLMDLIMKLESNTYISESKELLVNELSATNEKFFNTIHNPKLIETLIEGSSSKEYPKNQFLEESEDESFFINQSNLIDVVQNLENKIKVLQSQNESLKKRRQPESDFYQGKIKTESFEEDVNKLKKNYGDAKRKFEEEIKNLRKKITLLEEDNSRLTKNANMVLIISISIKTHSKKMNCSRKK